MPLPVLEQQHSVIYNHTTMAKWTFVKQAYRQVWKPVKLLKVIICLKIFLTDHSKFYMTLV